MDTREHKDIDCATPETEGDPRKNLHEALLNDPSFRKRFRTICRFASGGMGVVSKARDLALERVVAVKSLKEEYEGDPEQREAFLRECRFHARLDHPSIVPVYAVGISDRGALSMAMKFIRGISLKEFIQKEREKYRRRGRGVGGADFRCRLEYFLRILEAVAYCHSMQIVHGDLKPENIQLGAFGELYIMDWGCARSKGSSPLHAAGTLNYLPPEFLREKIVTPLLDIFALGMILFELSTLRRARNTPCTEEGRGHLSIYDRKSYFFYPGRIPVPPRLKAVILKAVDPVPFQRYQSVEELMQDVRGVLFNGEVKAYGESRMEKFVRYLRNHAFLSLAAVFLLIFLLSSSYLLVLLYHTAEEERNKKEVIRQAKIISCVHFLSLPVTRDFLRAKAKLLFLADNLLTSRVDNKSGKKTGILPPLPPLESFRKICRKVHQHEIYPTFQNEKIRKTGSRMPPLLPIVKSMGVFWENGSLYKQCGEMISVKNFLPPPFPDLPGNICWGKVFYLPEEGKHFLFCHTPLYGKTGTFFGRGFLELDLEKLLSPLIRFKSRYPHCDLYFIPGEGELLQVKEGELALNYKKGALRHESIQLRELLKKIMQIKRMFTRVILEKKVYYAASAELPAGDAFLLLLIEDKFLHSEHDLLKKGEEQGENFFSFQIF